MTKLIQDLDSRSLTATTNYRVISDESSPMTFYTASRASSRETIESKKPVSRRSHPMSADDERRENDQQIFKQNASLVEDLREPVEDCNNVHQRHRSDHTMH